MMIKFGTGGWREIIGDKFTKQNVQRIVLSISLLYPKEPLLISYDHRFLSKEAAEWCEDILKRRGHLVHFSSNPIPTPVHMHYVMKQELKLGLMITASHNPALYNGIKVIVKGGKDAPEYITTEIEELANELNPDALLKDLHKHDVIESIQVQPMIEYVESVLGLVDTSLIKKRNFRVLLDSMHGVSKDTMSMLLANSFVLVDIINGERDTLFGGITPAPELEALEVLRMKVRNSNRYDFGIATDADADRLAIVDDLGRYLDANTILALLYEHLLSSTEYKGDVVRNVTTTHLLDEIAQNYNYEAHEVPVGFKHISAEMKKYNAILGGESSGGIAFKTHIKGKDGIFSAMLVLEMLSQSGLPLSHMVDRLNKKYGMFYKSEYIIQLDNFNLNITERIMEIEKRFFIKGIEVNNITHLDGLKINYSDGSWLSVRPSGTEPILRLVSESRNERTSERIVQQAKEVIYEELDLNV